MKRIKFVCEDRGRHARVFLAHLDESNEPFVVPRMCRGERRAKSTGEEFHFPAAPGGGVTLPKGVFTTKRKRNGAYTDYLEYARNWHNCPGRPDGVEFLCPKCGRNPQRRIEEWGAAMEMVKVAGITEVDISLFPF